MTDNNQSETKRSRTTQAPLDMDDQLKWLQGQITDMVSASIKEIQQQLSQLAEEQRRLARELDSLKGGKRPAMDPQPSSESQGESELDLWADTDQENDPPPASEQGAAAADPREQREDQPEEELPLELSEMAPPPFEDQDRIHAREAQQEERAVDPEDEAFGDQYRADSRKKGLADQGRPPLEVRDPAVERRPGSSDTTTDQNHLEPADETDPMKPPADILTPAARTAPGSDDLLEDNLLEIDLQEDDLLGIDDTPVERTPEPDDADETPDRFFDSRQYQPEDPPEPKSAPRRWVWLLALAAVVALGIWAGGYFMPQKPQPAPEPSLVSSPVAKPVKTHQQQAAQTAAPAAPAGADETMKTTGDGPTPPDPRTNEGLAPEPAAPAAAGDEVIPDKEAMVPMAADPAKTGIGGKPDGIETMPPDAARYPFSILLASFKTFEQARTASEQYTRGGLRAYWAQVDLGEKGIWYRVFGGYFETDAAAREKIDEIGLPDAQVKQTRWTAWIGTYPRKTARSMAQRMAEEMPCAPYGIDDGQQQHLYVGAFITETGAKQQCEAILGNGFDCQVTRR